MSTRIRAWKDSDIDSQSASPLFWLPREIRQPIFELVFCPTVIPHPLALSHDFDVQDGHPPLSEADLEEAANKPRVGEPWQLPLNEEDPDPAPFLRGDDWLRPDNMGPIKIDCAFLRTSRRVYLETAHLPALQAELTIYDHGSRKLSPPWETAFDYDSGNNFSSFLPLKYVRHLRATIPYHSLTRISRMRWFSSLSQLPHSFVGQAWDSLAWKTDLLSRRPPLRQQPPPLRLFDQIRTLRLTLRCQDWTLYHASWPLAFNPLRRWDCMHERWWMENDMTRCELLSFYGRLDQLRPDKWSLAVALALLPSLRELTIDFETCQGREAEMERIVRWAVASWRFGVFGNPPKVKVPREWSLGDNHLVLGFAWGEDGDGEGDGWTHIYDIPPEAETLDGRPINRRWLVPPKEGMEGVKRWSWRGLPYHWARRCPVCLRDRRGCGYCEESRVLKEKGLGPRLYVWTVTWTAEEDVEFNRRAAEARGGDAAPEQEPEPEYADVPSSAVRVCL
jgi:hypothetical protein